MGLEEEYNQFLSDRQRQPGVKEHRPGEFIQSEFDEFTRRNESSQQVERFPYVATAAGLGFGLATYAITKSPGAAAAAATIASGNGELIQNITETLFDLPTKPQDAGEVARRVGRETLVTGISEGIGQGGVRLADKTGLLRFFSRSVTPEAKEAIQFFESQGLPAPTVLPAQATDSRALDVLNNISEHALFGGGVLQAKRLAQDSEHAQIANAFIESIAPHISAKDAGKLFVESAKGNFRLQTLPAVTIYNTIEKAVAPRTVDGALVGGMVGNIRALKAFANKTQEVSESLNAIGDDIVGGSVLRRINAMGDTLNVYRMIELRKRLRAIRQGLEGNIETKSAPAIGNLKALESMTDEAVEKAFIENRSPDLLNLWRQANKIYKNGSERFNNAILRKAGKMAGLDKSVPEDVVATAFAPGKTTRMQLMKDGVSAPVWQNIARAGMEDMVTRATKNGVLSGESLTKLLVGSPKQGGLGGEGLVVAVGATEAQRWLKFAHAMEVRQAKQAASEGSVLIQLTQGGALLTGLSAPFTDLPDSVLATSAGILLGPAAIARIMTNPTSARALIEGMSRPAITSATQRAGFGAQLTARIFQAFTNPKVDRQPETPKAFRQRQDESLVRADTEQSLFRIGAR